MMRPQATERLKIARRSELVPLVSSSPQRKRWEVIDGSWGVTTFVHEDGGCRETRNENNPRFQMPNK